MPGPPTTTPLRTCLDIHSHSLVAMPGSDTMWHAWATNYHSPVVLPTTTSLCLCLGHHTVLWLCLGHPLPQPCRYAWDAHYNRPVPIPRPPTTAALSLCLGLALPCGYTHYHRTDAWATHHRSPTALWLCLGSSAQLYRYAWATHYHSPVAMPRPTRLQHSPGYA